MLTPESDRKKIASSIGSTRNSSDFATHIDNTIVSEEQAKWIFHVDQLNTNKSEALVRLVAQHCQIDVELGIKGKKEILQSMEK